VGITLQCIMLCISGCLIKTWDKIDYNNVHMTTVLAQEVLSVLATLQIGKHCENYSNSVFTSVLASF